MESKKDTAAYWKARHKALRSELEEAFCKIQHTRTLEEARLFKLGVLAVLEAVLTEEPSTRQLGDDWTWLEIEDPEGLETWELEAEVSGRRIRVLMEYVSTWTDAGYVWEVTLDIQKQAGGKNFDTYMSGKETAEESLRAACPCPALAGALTRSWDRRKEEGTT